jgi:hypothetical protein
MRASPDDILDRMRTREVTGVFHARKALVAAAEELLVAGFDRADIDVSAPADEMQQRLNYASIPAADIADIPIAPRRPFIGGDDIAVTLAVVGSISGCVTAVATGYFLVVKDVGPLVIGILSVLCGLVVAGISMLVVRRRFDQERRRGLDKLSEWDGLLIWVRVHSPEKEALAQEILVRHGGDAVHVHEIELARRTDDLPLHSLRPDPWLGDERLGQP